MLVEAAVIGDRPNASTSAAVHIDSTAGIDHGDVIRHPHIHVAIHMLLLRLGTHEGLILAIIETRILKLIHSIIIVVVVHTTVAVVVLLLLRVGVVGWRWRIHGHIGRVGGRRHALLE